MYKRQRLNKLYFAYTDLSPEVQQAYKDLIPYFGGVEDLLQEMCIRDRDSTVHALNVEAGKTATLTVADTPKVTETLIDLFKIDMETGKSTPQGNASLEGAEFAWSYYDGRCV